MFEGVEIAGLSTTWTCTWLGFVAVEAMFECVLVAGLATSPAKEVQVEFILCLLGSTM